VAANAWDIVLKKMSDIAQFDRAVKVGIQAVLLQQKGRVFFEGQDASSGKIGQYSTNPISIAKNKQARNTGKTYFPGGYAEYKSAIGKNPGYVNLRNTDQMNMDYAFFDLGNSSYGLGFANPENFNKSKWMEEKYGTSIFNQSQKEGETLNKVIEHEVGKDLP
jgi:hypothetical protein